ncbi:MAG: M1 family metallopeptidase [Bacteroidia bacterium]
MKHIKQGVLVAILIAFQIQSSKAQSSDYFQQQVRYNIDVKLDDKRHMLLASETIEYTNHSPQILNEIWFHLWPNAYKNNETEFARQELASGKTRFHFAKDEERGFIDSLDFKVNGIAVKFEYDVKHIDIARIILNEPLIPGATISISTPFRVKLPSSDFSRLGHTGQQYQLCQWYPKPAVYDRKGWHPMPYVNQGEFFSEYGSFEVRITVPKNYVIAASGVMDANTEEERQIEENIAKTNAWFAEGMPLSKDSLKSDASTKTVTYRLDNVHDFAWFTDKASKIRKSSVQLERSGRTVETWVYFTPQNGKEWKNAVQYVNDAVKYYSRWAGDYPYSVCKALDGALSAGGGMEYPTITIISPMRDTVMLDEVIAHEVGHNWFYGILGSNERDHAWMDEGTNSYYEKRYMRTKYPNHTPLDAMISSNLTDKLGVDKFNPYYLQTITYMLSARNAIDQPLCLHASDYIGLNYGAMVYEKTSVLYNYLAAYLGQETFDAMMVAYFEKWKFKHPYPEDLRQHAESFTGKNLNWFFDELINTRKRIDYSIGKIKHSENGYTVTVRNKGETTSPIGITLKPAGSNQMQTFWFEGSLNKQKLSIPNTNPQKGDWFSVNGTGEIPDLNPKNDQKSTSGLFRRNKPGLGILTSLERAGKRSLYVFPALGYNVYNGFMTGAILSNLGIFRKRFEYVAVPMYATGNGQLTGSANADYQFRPISGIFRTITLGATGARYSFGENDHFNRIVGSIAFRFDNLKKPASKINQELTYRYIHRELQREGQGNDLRNFHVLNYEYSDSKVLKPWSFNAELQHYATFVKSSITYTRRFPYLAKKKGLDMRLFAGGFLWKRNDFSSGAVDGRFRLSGQSGYQDYLFDDVFFGRNEISGIAAQQMSMTDGFFALPTIFGQSDRFLTSMNLMSTLPGKIPLRLFANAAATSYNIYPSGLESTIEPTIKTEFAAEAGICWPLVRNVFEVYLPLVYTQNLKDAFGDQSFEKRIRFVLNVKLVNPARAIRRLGT